ncbi:hypothetical protein MMC06_004830 [Schaereria dolodes]|nr:hypothetical protein [Schaereria dolodes]
MCQIDRHIHPSCGHFRKHSIRIQCLAGWDATSHTCLGLDPASYVDVFAEQWPICPTCYRVEVDSILEKYAVNVRLIEHSGYDKVEFERWRVQFEAVKDIEMRLLKLESNVWADG